MNHTELRDFSSETLTLISGLITKRTAIIRERNANLRTPDENEELERLIVFQTQTEYAKMLVLKEEKTLSN